MLVALICVAAAVAGYFVMTAGTRPARDQRLLTGWLYAHRGLHNAERPENSIAAFRSAVDAGYGIELDVHLTADNVVAVFHDASLERMTGAKGSIESLTFEELRQLRLGGTGEMIPSLEEVLEAVQGRVPLLIETKTPGGFATALERETQKLLDGYNGKYALQSFSPFSVRWFRKNVPQELRGQLSSTFRPPERGVSRVAQFVVRHLLVNFLGRPNFISYAADGLHFPVVQRLRRNGLPVLAWTVRSAAQAAELKPLCDTIIFEGFLPDRQILKEE